MTVSNSIFVIDLKLIKWETIAQADGTSAEASDEHVELPARGAHVSG